MVGADWWGTAILIGRVKRRNGETGKRYPYYDDNTKVVLLIAEC